MNFGKIGNVVALSGSQRMIEGDIDDAVAILDIEDHCIAAHFAPVSDDALAMVAASHHSGQINRAHFEISCNWDGFLYNWRFENSGDDDLLSGLQENSLAIVIGGADGFGQFRWRSGILSASDIYAPPTGCCLHVGFVNVGARRGTTNGRRSRARASLRLWYRPLVDQLHAVRVLRCRRRRSEKEAGHGHTADDASEACHRESRVE